MPITVTDPGDERVRDYVALTDMALRTRAEPAGGPSVDDHPAGVGGQGGQALRRALAAGHRPRSFLMASRWLTDLRDLVDRAEDDGVPVYVGERDVLRALTGFHLHRGALASMHRPAPPAPDDVIASARRLVVLEDIVDHTNVGAIFRSAAALGVDGVLVTPRCADPLYRRSIRVSMGTVFQVPWARLPGWPHSIATLRDLGFCVASLALAPDGVGLEEFAAEPPERIALVLGTEGDGLSRRTIEGGDVTVTIPMSGDVDSLNVAAAGAVTMWALRVPHAAG